MKPKRELGGGGDLYILIVFFLLDYTHGHVAEHLDLIGQDDVLLQVFCFFLLCVFNCLFRKFDDFNNVCGYNSSKGKSLIKCFDIALIISICYTQYFFLLVLLLLRTEKRKKLQNKNKTRMICINLAIHCLIAKP